MEKELCIDVIKVNDISVLGVSIASASKMTDLISG